MTKHIADIDEVLTTTRAVRNRLDFERNVESDVIVECLEMAQQASVGSNQENWMVVLVRDADQKKRIADLYRIIWNKTVVEPLSKGDPSTLVRLSPTMREGEDAQIRQARILDGVKYLVDRLQDVPLLIIACSSAPQPRAPIGGAASGYYGSIFPFVWSLQLALRSRGLGSVLATAIAHKHLELAQILNLPRGCHPVTMIPVAYTKGLSFRRAVRQPLDQIYRWDRWLDDPAEHI